jgi:hypothetical protein
MGGEGKTTAYFRILALKPVEFHLESHKFGKLQVGIVVRRISLSDLIRVDQCANQLPSKKVALCS